MIWWESYNQERMTLNLELYRDAILYVVSMEFWALGGELKKFIFLDHKKKKVFLHAHRAAVAEPETLNSEDNVYINL